MQRPFLLLFLAIFLSATATAQHPKLQSGPMLGYSEFCEVLIWAQTTGPAQVEVEYWAQARPDSIFSTGSLRTSALLAYSAKFVADQVQPGTEYEYRLRIDGEPVTLPYPTEFTTQPLWQWRTDAPDFTVAFGSCNYINEPRYDRPGNPYGGEYEIFTTIHEQRPDLMIWLGDNTYLREVDWYTRTGIQHRYTHTRSVPELQPLLASTHHFAIWDDHDFGPNNSDRSWIHKDKALEVFRQFWGNPTFGIPGGMGGITSFFKYNDVDFFLLDNRYFRSPNDRQTGPNILLGGGQVEWLIDALTFSRATFKVICVGGQVLNTAEVYETYANLAPEERAYLLSRIEEEEIKGVIFLTGDRHHTELSKLTTEKDWPIYDITVSPLTSSTGSSRDNEYNDLRVPGTLVLDRNFGLLNVSGPRDDRRLRIDIYDTAGEPLWEYEIQANEWNK
jgi:alkaline phosphatase D